MTNESGPVPTREDWGNLEVDPDVTSGYENFGGKTVEEAVSFCAENPIEAAAELRFTPAKVWNYYIFCFARYLISPKSQGAADAASCFLRLVRDRAREAPHELKEIWIALRPAVIAVSERQDFYGASEDIYGSFRDLRHETEEALSRAAKSGSAGELES